MVRDGFTHMPGSCSDWLVAEFSWILFSQHAVSGILHVVSLITYIQESRRWRQKLAILSGAKHRLTKPQIHRARQLKAVSPGLRGEKQTSALKGRGSQNQCPAFIIYCPPSDHKLCAFLPNPKTYSLPSWTPWGIFHYSISSKAKMLHIDRNQEWWSSSDAVL